jgi:hypothetical protein
MRVRFVLLFAFAIGAPLAAQIAGSMTEGGAARSRVAGHAAQTVDESHASRIRHPVRMLAASASNGALPVPSLSFAPVCELRSGFWRAECGCDRRER